MIETMEKELENQFTDLLSIVNNDDEANLDVINTQLTKELNEQLQNIELVKEELDEELRKRDSIIEFEKLDQNSYFSNESKELINYFDTTDLFQKNNCETIEEEKGEDFKIDNLKELNYFNLSRTNLNSVIEEDENEDSSQNDDLIELTIDNDNELRLKNQLNKELNKELNEELNKELNNNDDHDTLSSKNNKKRNSSINSSNYNSINSSVHNSSINDSSFLTKNSISSLNTSQNTTENSIISSTINLKSTNLTTSILDSIPNSLKRNESMINLDNLNTETNILINNIMKKGILSIWQLNKFNKSLTSSASTNSLKSSAKRIFFSIGSNKLKSWKPRYFMLTENYLLCFKKGNKSDSFLSKMGKFQFKLNLLDDIRSIELKDTTTHGKSYCIDLNDGAMFLFDKDFSLLKEWYDLIFKARQRFEMFRQEQEIKHRKEKQEIQRKEILSDRIERRKLILSNCCESSSGKRESLLDKFSEKYLEKPSCNNSSSKLTNKSIDKLMNKLKKNDDDFTFEYLNNLKQRLTGSTSVTELNRSNSNLAQIKTNTPIINNRKRMSLQRKSLLSQFDSFLGSPLSHSSKQQLQHQSNLDNMANLTNLANLTAGCTSWDTNQNSNKSQLNECTASPTMLPRIAPQCQGGLQNGQLNKQQNKQLTNSYSVFQFNNNTNSKSLHSSPFTINNSPALTQRSLYAERILSNSSLTLSNQSNRFSNSRNSTLSTGTSFSNSLFKPFRESIHYATSLRKDNLESKSHLKSATSEFSFIRLTNNDNNSNTSTLTKTQADDDTLKRNKSNFNRFNRMHSFANDCTSDYLDSEQDQSNSISNSDYNSDTLRNELRNSKTITNLNSELSKRTHILNSNDIGLGHLNHLNNLSNRDNQLTNNQLINKNHHYYQKMKKINNSLDESDSTFSSSNSSSSSSNNYNLMIKRQNEFNKQRQSTRLDQINNLKEEILCYSPNSNVSRINQLNYPHNNHNLKLITNSPLINQRNQKKKSIQIE